MDLLIELLKMSIPAIVVSVTVVFIISGYFRNSVDLREQELKLKTREVSLPLRLQAFERLVLLMERISINNLLIRLSSSGMSVQDYTFELIHTINQEFEHNLAQQLYVSNAAWEKVKGAKDTMILMVNSCAESLDRNAPASALVDMLLNQLSRQEIYVTTDAIFFLKKEAEKFE